MTIDVLPASFICSIRQLASHGVICRAYIIVIFSLLVLAGFEPLILGLLVEGSTTALLLLAIAAELTIYIFRCTTSQLDLLYT
jgi:hypothetical protein